MKTILYGSQTSPFVRRLRLLMGRIPHEFKEVDIFGAHAQEIHDINPLNQIPVFSDGDLRIWDSRQIFNYLNQKHQLQSMSWEGENLLTAIEGAMTAGINLLLLKRSGFDVDAGQLFPRRQKERIASVLGHLESFMKGPGRESWDFQAMSLYSFLDWLNFRSVVPLPAGAGCEDFLRAHADRPSVLATQIPKGN